MGKKLLVCLMIGAIVTWASVAFASDIGFKGANLRLGYVMPEDPIESTIGFGGGLNMGNITDDIGLEIVLFYWSKSYDVGIVEWKYSDFAIKVHGKYFFPQETFTPYVGGGLGFHMYSFEWEQPASAYWPAFTFDDSETKIGIHLLGGIEYPFNEKMSGIAEIEYDLADLDQFIISAGVEMKFGK